MLTDKLHLCGRLSILSDRHFLSEVELASLVDYVETGSEIEVSLYRLPGKSLTAIIKNLKNILN